jgi:hypothetical protein
MAQAQGSLVAILDADDTAMAQRVAHQVEYLTEHPDVVTIGAGIVTWEEQTGRTRTIVYRSNAESLRLLLSAGYNPIPHSTMTYWRTAFEKVGGYAHWPDRLAA